MESFHQCFSTETAASLAGRFADSFEFFRRLDFRRRCVAVSLATSSTSSSGSDCSDHHRAACSTITPVSATLDTRFPVARFITSERKEVGISEFLEA